MPRLCPGSVCCFSPLLFGCDGGGQGDANRLREEDFLETSSNSSVRTTEGQTISNSNLSQVWIGYSLYHCVVFSRVSTANCVSVKLF